MDLFFLTVEEDAFKLNYEIAGWQQGGSSEILGVTQHNSTKVRPITPTHNTNFN